MSDDKIPALLTAFNVFNATHGRAAEDRLAAFLASLAASGYAVVPVEATGEMLVAGRDAIRAARSSGVGGQTIGNSIRMECYREAACWRAMLTAVQEERE